MKERCNAFSKKGSAAIKRCSKTGRNYLTNRHGSKSIIVIWDESIEEPNSYMEVLYRREKL